MSAEEGRNEVNALLADALRLSVRLDSAARRSRPALYLWHVRNLSLRDVEIVAMADDARAAIILQDVAGADLFHIKTPPNAPVLQLHDCSDVKTLWVRGVPDGPQP